MLDHTQTQPSCIVPVILSGGSGTRLWPVSTIERPKQFHPIFSLQSMIRATAERVQDKTLFQNPVIVGSIQHLSLIGENLKAHPPETLILEPFGRNTAAAIAIAALKIAETQADAIMLVLASDHAIHNQDAFIADIQRAAALAQNKKLVTFGVKPDRAHIGYGYIEHGALFSQEAKAYQIKRFIEKPELLMAQAMVDTGHYSWNSGMFLFRADCVLEEFARLAPELLATCKATLAASKIVDSNIFLSEDAFCSVPAVAFDVAIMEKTDIGIMLSASFDWSDVGCWSAVYEISQKDLLGNAVTGKCILAGGTSDSLIRNNTDTPLYITGVDNIVVVVTEAGIVISAKSLTQDIKNAAHHFKTAG